MFLKAKSIMQKNVQSIDENELLNEAIEKMIFFKISCLIVTRKGNPQGLLTERDLTNRVLSKQKNIKKVKVKDIMTTPIVSKSKNYSLSKTMKLMNEYNIRHLPIIEDNRVIGIITQTDLARHAQKVMNFLLYAQFLFIFLIILLMIL